MKLYSFIQNRILKYFTIVLLVLSVALFPLSPAIAKGEGGKEQSTTAVQAIEVPEDVPADEAEAEEDIATESKKAEMEKIAKAKSLYEAKEEQYKKATADVSAINDEIEDLESNIIKTIEQINKLEDEAKALQGDIDNMFNQFKGRLKAIYMSGNFTDIQALLSADTFSDYLTRSEMIKAVSAKDAESIQKMQKAYNKLKNKEKKIELKRASLEDDEADLQTNKADLELKKASAAKAYNESIELLKEVDKKSKATKVQIRLEQQELKKIISMCKKEAQISKDIAEAIKNGDFKNIDSEIVSNGGLICFPVPSCRKVSCGFYGYTNHNGMDFSSAHVNGQKVVAAADGKVMSVKLLDYSYGHHVWINHGDEVATIYAHMSRIIVREGQLVKQGQVIGYVGSTGNSTGPHLHFGLLINGSFVNPINYF